MTRSTRPPNPARARRRVLAEWRRVDLTDVEVARQVKGKALGEILPSVLQTLKLDRKKAESHILTVWRQAIDPLITAHAQPTALVKGTLFVSVDSNVWLDELQRYRRREILERMQHAMGREMIQKLSLRLG